VIRRLIPAWGVILSVLVCSGLLIAAPKPRIAQPRPNVILVTMDTLRADHLGCYGDKQIETPTLDSLARDSVVFDGAIAQVPLTWPSHAAILTGTYPFQNGVQDFTGHPLSPQFRSLAQAFKQAGYATGAVVSSFVLDRSWGLARGFDYYDDAFSAAAFQKKDLGLVDRKAAESVSHALQWLQKTPRRPFFLWLHLYDPHSPYDPPEPYRTQYHDRLYDGEIAYADHELGRLIAWLKSARLYDNTAIAFLSDHGESLGDHGEKEHGFFIYNSTTRVPLILKPPSAAKRHLEKIAFPVESIAVAPTLLALARVKDPIQKQFQATDLLAGSDKSANAAYSETFYPFSSFGWSPLHALETSRYHYVDAPQAELYDVIADPEEKTNIAGRQNAIVAVLKKQLQERLKTQVEDGRPRPSTSDQNPGLNPDAAEKLRALGYVAYQSPVSAEALAAGLPDPKAKLWEFNSILEAQDAFHEGYFAKGESLLVPVREQDPQMYLVPFMLGEAALRQQKWAEASAEMKKCLDLNPSFDQAMTGLARALMNTGNTDEAKKWLNQALKQNPQNYRAWYELAMADARTDKAVAIADLEKAVAIQPNFAFVRRELGILQVQQKSYLDALKNLRTAADLGMDDAPLYNFMGIAYSNTNQLQKAVSTYQHALKLQPNLAEAHLNLAYAYQRLNRTQSARAEYQAACRLEEKFCKFVPAP
jgi:arylsulfatase A-like enzyme/Flp pilus assembly protein TadD